MKTEQILLVLAVVRSRSISKAADSLFISQPTASSMLKALENELGYPLFTRTRAGAVPTVEGVEFIKYAEAIERSLKGIGQINKPVKRTDLTVVTFRSDFTELAFEKLCDEYLAKNVVIGFNYHTVNSTDEGFRMMEDGVADIAIAVCRSSYYESLTRNAAKWNLEIQEIDTKHLEVTCRQGHPILQGGSISYELFGAYPCFSSVQTSDSDLYAPYSLTKQDVNVASKIVMSPCDARCRLLAKTQGYLISIPLSDEVKARFGLESLPIDDSSITVFALYRNDPQKEEVIQSYIKNCSEFL